MIRVWLLPYSRFGKDLYVLFCGAAEGVPLTRRLIMAENDWRLGKKDVLYQGCVVNEDAKGKRRPA